MNKFKLFFFLFITGVSVVLIIYGINLFPIPGTDSRVFVPPALFYSNGLGFINPLYDITFLYGLYANSAQNFQFNYYVPFFSIALGSINKLHPGIKSVFVICALFSVTNILLYGKIVMSYFSKPISPIVGIIILGSVTYLATYILPTIGRPENLSSLLIFILYILYQKRNKINAGSYNVLICTLFALIFATQLIGFYFSFFFFITQELLNSRNIYKTILLNAIRFIIVGLLFIEILYLSPNGFLNTINGISVHGSWALMRSDRTVKFFIYYWTLSPLNFGFIIIFILSAIIYIRSFFENNLLINKLHLSLIILAQIFVLYGILKFILYASPTVYNATQFIFPLSCFLFSNILSINIDRIKKIVVPLCAVVIIGGNIIFIRWAVLFVDYKNSGRDYAAAVQMSRKIANEHDKVFFTADLWPLFYNVPNAKLFNGIYKTGDVVIVQQIYTKDISAYLKKSAIIYDWRIEPRRKVFGIPLTNTPQCYSFVVCKMN